MKLVALATPGRRSPPSTWRRTCRAGRPGSPTPRQNCAPRGRRAPSRRCSPTTPSPPPRPSRASATAPAGACSSAWSRSAPRASSPAAQPSASTGSERHGAEAEPRTRLRPRARRPAAGIALARMEGPGRGGAVRRGEAGDPRHPGARRRARLRPRAPARRPERRPARAADRARQGRGELCPSHPPRLRTGYSRRPSTSRPTRSS